MFNVDLTGREARESGVSSVIVDDTGENTTTGSPNKQMNEAADRTYIVNLIKILVLTQSSFKGKNLTLSWNGSMDSVATKNTKMLSLCVKMTHVHGYPRQINTRYGGTVAIPSCGYKARVLHQIFSTSWVHTDGVMFVAAGAGKTVLTCANV